MTYKQHRDELKAFGKISGFWTWLAYMMHYRTKEFFAVIIFVLIGWLVTLIIDPRIADSIRSYFVKLLK